MTVAEQSQGLSLPTVKGDDAEKYKNTSSENSYSVIYNHGLLKRETIDNIYVECSGKYGQKQDYDWIIPYLPSITTGFFVVLGWIVVNKLQSNRERRKQIKDSVNQLIKDLHDLEESMIKYHTNARDEAMEQSLISRLTRFEKACGSFPRFVSNQRFKAAKVDGLEVSPKAIQQLRKAMTLNHFNDEHVIPLSTDSNLIADIRIETDNVRDALEKVLISVLD